MSRHFACAPPANGRHDTQFTVVVSLRATDPDGPGLHPDYAECVLAYAQRAVAVAMADEKRIERHVRSWTTERGLGREPQESRPTGRGSPS
jgi:hypothetical protein